MKLHGEIKLPGDKSITHRALMIGAMCEGDVIVNNPLISEDIMASINILIALGIEVKQYNDHLIICGKGIMGFTKPKIRLNCFNSGTTARLLLGLLTGYDFDAVLIGDKSLSKRPMRRVVKHLQVLNSNILLKEENYLPAHILPTNICANQIKLDVSSAQVKTAVMLAALKSKKTTTIYELTKSRDHTERLLAYLGCDISVKGLEIKLSGKNELKPLAISVPGDFSAAAFFIVATLITPGSEILIKACGLNSTRSGIFTVLKQIDANIKIFNQKTVNNEISGDILIKYQDKLKPFLIDGALVPLLIDEIPILALLATQIDGISIIKSASELRVKESDRIKVTTEVLSLLNADVRELKDGLIISGKTRLKPQVVNTYNDHRISMMLKVARLICEDLIIINSDCDKISYPEFENDLRILMK